MPDLIVEVQPGDLIKADQWKLLVGRLIALETTVQQLSGTIGGGTITVPNVFGLTLTQARTILTAPAQQLALGAVFDAFGQLINPNATANASLRVINQIPVPGSRTIPGAGVSLVVAAIPSSVGGETPNLPLILEIAPTPSPVDTQVEIRGQRFAPLNTDNVVTFDNVPTPQPPSALSNVGSLFVTIPKGIPGAPTQNNQPNKSNVVVRVTTPNGVATFNNAVIAPPPAQLPPTITAITPSPANVGGNLNVDGQNFATTAAGNQVRFDNNPALTVTPNSITPLAGGVMRLTVTIPTGISGLTQIGTIRTDVPIAVIKVGQPVPDPLQTFPASIRRLS